MSALSAAQLLLLALVVLASFTAQSMTGFGATVLALTLGALFAPIAELRWVLVALNLPLSLLVVVRDRGRIDRPLLLGAVLPAMGTGLVAGLAASRWLEGALLRRLFGALVCALALRALLRLARPAPAEPADDAPGRSAMLAWLVAAGVVHGVYASGGPLVALALDRQRIDRSAYRATLMVLWLGFSALLLAQALLRGLWTPGMSRATLLLLPALPLAGVLGERLHHRVSDRVFQGAIHLTLAVAGAALLR